MAATGKKIVEILNHPEWHEEMCCDRETHPLHEASVEVEFTPEERRAFDFPPCCAKSTSADHTSTAGEDLQHQREQEHGRCTIPAEREVDTHDATNEIGELAEDGRCGQVSRQGSHVRGDCGRGRSRALSIERRRHR
jgi:hypothetical protein